MQKPVKKSCIHPPSNSSICVLTDVTRHSIVNQELSGLPSFIKCFSSMPAVWCIRYMLCHSCTKSIFVLFSWNCLWKRILLFSFSNTVCSACQTSWQDIHSALTIYEPVTQNLDKLALILLVFYLHFDRRCSWLWLYITLTFYITSLEIITASCSAPYFVINGFKMESHCGRHDVERLGISIYVLYFSG